MGWAGGRWEVWALMFQGVVGLVGLGWSCWVEWLGGVVYLNIYQKTVPVADLGNGFSDLTKQQNYNPFALLDQWEVWDLLFQGVVGLVGLGWSCWVKWLGGVEGSQEDAPVGTTAEEVLTKTEKKHKDMKKDKKKDKKKDNTKDKKNHKKHHDAKDDGEKAAVVFPSPRPHSPNHPHPHFPDLQHPHLHHTSTPTLHTSTTATSYSRRLP